MTNSLNLKSHNLLKMVIFDSFLAITPVPNLIVIWGFWVDDPCDFPYSPLTPHYEFTESNMTQPLKKDNFWQFIYLNGFKQ